MRLRGMMMLLLLLILMMMRMMMMMTTLLMMGHLNSWICVLWTPVVSWGGYLAASLLLCSWVKQVCCILFYFTLFLESWKHVKCCGYTVDKLWFGFGIYSSSNNCVNNNEKRVQKSNIKQKKIVKIFKPSNLHTDIHGDTPSYVADDKQRQREYNF